MSGTFTLLQRLSMALGAALVLVAAIGFVCAYSDDPEPAYVGKEEAATPAVDLEKAKSDKKVAQQAERNVKASIDNLKKIALAVHAYNDEKNFLPDDIKDKNGKVLLSWRVAILPHLDKKKLYEEFELDE